MSYTIITLVEHILAMKDDAYLTGHPEWAEIVKGAIKVRDSMFDAAMDADAPLDAIDRSFIEDEKRHGAWWEATRREAFDDRD